MDRIRRAVLYKGAVVRIDLGHGHWFSWLDGGGESVPMVVKLSSSDGGSFMELSIQLVRWARLFIDLTSPALLVVEE